MKTEQPLEIASGPPMSMASLVDLGAAVSEQWRIGPNREVVLERSPFKRGAPTDDMHNFATHPTLLPSFANVRAGKVVEVLCTKKIPQTDRHRTAIII